MLATIKSIIYCRRLELIHQALIQVTEKQCGRRLKTLGQSWRRSQLVNKGRIVNKLMGFWSLNESSYLQVLLYKCKGFILFGDWLFNR